MEQNNAMMPNGLPAGPNNTMQRPQSGNWGQQVHAKVIEYLRSTMSQFQGGWQAVVDLRERANKIMQLITMLRAINQGQNLQNCISIAQNFEMRTLQNALSKEQYNEEINTKMRDITLKRQQQAGNLVLPGAMMPGQNNQMPNMFNNTGNAQPNGMPFQNGAPGMGMQPGQMGFGQNPMFNGQLQRPMQPSPLNMQQSQQQQQQQPITMDPSALQIPPQQQKQPQNLPNMGQSNGSQPQHLGTANQGLPPQQEVLNLAKQFYDQMTDEQKNTVRQKIIATMPEQQRQAMKGDPVMRWCASRAANELKKRQAAATGGSMNNFGAQNDGASNLQMGNNMPPRPPSQTGGQIDFGNFLGQQANARKLQESGEQVVPASNNAMGMGGQLGMPQNINPSMLNNQNGQGSQPNNNNMDQSFMMQMSAQARELMQKQLMAQQHAMASRNQLQGQPGGLHAQSNFNNGAAGQVNSPAMSMLNRPMAPPGQATPNTPQPNRPQPTPPTPMNNNIVQLSQHHQDMIQNNQQQQQQQQQQVIPGVSANPSMAELLAKVPPQFREKLASLPIEQVKQFLWKWSMNQGNRRQPQPGQPGQPAQPTQPTQPGQFGLPNNLQNQSGHQMQSGMPPQMGNAIPGFNSQPPSNQMLMDPAQRQKHQEAMKMRSGAMDMFPYPKSILATVKTAVPPQIATFGALKQFVFRALGPEAAQNVALQQNQFFQAHPDAQSKAMAAFVNKFRAQQAGQGAAQQPQMQMQGNGIQPPAPTAQAPPAAQMAPPAQMIPPAPVMQTPNQGMPQGQNQGLPKMPSIPPPTPQEMAMFRSKVPVAQNMTDDQIRSLIIKNKIERLRAFQAQQKQQQTGQALGQPNKTGMLPQNGMPNAPQPTQRAPQPALSQPPPNLNESKTVGQGNDVVEISSQQAQQAVPQGFQAQNSLTGAQAMRRPPNLSQEQLNRMTDAQKREYHQKMQQAMQAESFRKAQNQFNPQGGQAPVTMPGFPPQQAEKIRKMAQEVAMATPKGAAVQLDEAGFQRARELLKKLWGPLRQLATTYPAAIAYGFDEQRIKDMMRAKEIIMQNAMDETGQIRDYLAVTPQTLENISRTIQTYMMDLKNRKERLDAHRKQAQASNQGQPSSGHSQQQQAPPMAPTTSQQGHVRKPSASAKAPPAPTTDNKVFDWGPRPDGVPKYDSTRNDLTPDKLKFPAQKRRKTTEQIGSSASTPAAQGGTPVATGASPSVAKAQSPEQQRKSQAQLAAEATKEAEKKKFRCKDTSCEASLRGFETEDQLKQHEQAQHQVVENPLEFLLDNASKALDMQASSKPVQKLEVAHAKQASAPASTKPRVAAVRDLKKEDLSKIEMDQIARGLTPASVKDKIAKKQAESDAAAKSAEKDLTLGDAMTQKLGITLPDEQIQDAAVTGVAQAGDCEDSIIPANYYGWDSVTIDSLSQMIEEGWVETDTGSGLWELRPGGVDVESSPELTPGSQSSEINQSDAMKFTISMENMDADLFGDGSGGVPESLVPIYHQIKDMDLVNANEDVIMGGSDEKEGQSPKKRKAEEMWEKPIGDDFDDFFNFS